jgi:hypothetical protein
VVITLGGTINGDPGTANAMSGYTRLCTVKDSGAGYHTFTEIWVKQIVGAASSQTATVTNAVSISDGLIYFHISSIANANATQNGGTIVRNDVTDENEVTGSMTLSAAPTTDDFTVACRILFPTGSTDPSATPGSGWAESYDTTGTGGYGGFETQWRPDGSTSATVVWVDVNDGNIGVTAYTSCAAVIKK